MNYVEYLSAQLPV